MVKSTCLHRTRILFVALIFLTFLSGCATVHEMAVDGKAERLDLQGKGMVLLSMEVFNQVHADYQPRLVVINLETPGAEDKAHRHNFKVDEEGMVAGASGRHYLARMALAPGRYLLVGAPCLYHSLFIVSSCYLPILGEIDVVPNTVLYLGRVSGVIRQRKGEEFRAGPVIPLVDQAVTGFAQGTFDVTISDHQDEDIAEYRRYFPALAEAEIKVMVLPPFDRARAQAWWETNGKSEKERAAKAADDASTEHSAAN